MQSTAAKSAKPLTAKQLKKQAKLAKFEQKAKSGTVANPPKKTVQPVLTESTFVNTTPPGEKKEMNNFGVYDPIEVESAWMDWWIKQGYFKPEFNSTGPKYVITYPPPNVTGKLHIGHALTTAVQDTLMRYHRMRGFSCLYLPGCDHAGIATQSVVEKRLFKSTGKTRHDLGRTAFLEKVWEWKNEYSTNIYSQMKRLGGSFDWDRATFTMDPHMQDAVQHAFIKMFNDGLIYRDTKLVNWCSHLNTALSNLEVDQIPVKNTKVKLPGYKKPMIFGQLMQFKYQLCSKSGELVDKYLTIATTRLETLLGDVAVCVHPDDPRYADIHNMCVYHPLLKTVLPIVKDTYVDLEFGTGVVKITPAHDLNDFQIGKTHNLPSINMLFDDGTIDCPSTKYHKMPRFEARLELVKDLTEMNLFVDVQPHQMNLPICSRSGDVVEPRSKPQWYMKCDELSKRALENRPEILPILSDQEYTRWLENPQDWCLSRQLWWGHEIPAYRVLGIEDEKWVCAKNKEEALELAKKYNGTGVQQDGDVLDTWFSSGLWPFATLGWPNQVSFYPTSLLETGKDILFFWVARMIMMGLYFTDQLPFKQVFCHAMVRDAQGRKMSKSLGNVVDPINVIEGCTLEQLQETLVHLDKTEQDLAKKGQLQQYPNGIPRCGTDALRFALCAYTSDNASINLDILRVEGYRKFCNKMWNAIKFGIQKLPSDYECTTNGPNSLVSKWIMSKLTIATKEVHLNLKVFNFMQATNSIYRYFYEVCDVYIEAQKMDLDQETLFHALDGALKLFHPFMPFITEELWQRLPGHVGESICVAKYPEDKDYYYNESEMNDMDLIINVIKTMRSMMDKYNMSKAKSNLFLYSVHKINFKLF